MIKKFFIISLTTISLQGCTNISSIFNNYPLVESHTTKASWYEQGYKTASGARFNPKSLTAAHRDYPFGTLVKITNLDNNKEVVAMINDRGPFVKGRDLDVSRQVAIELNFIKKGVTTVTYHKIN
jgi:rare lipoprotein A